MNKTKKCLSCGAENPPDTFPLYGDTAHRKYGPVPDYCGPVHPYTRREQVCDAIVAFQRVHGFAPTLRELAEACGLASTSSVARYLDTLRAEGVVTWVDGQARTLRVVREVGV